MTRMNLKVAIMGLTCFLGERVSGTKACSNMIPTPTITPTITPTPTPTPTMSCPAGTEPCSIALPTTTMMCMNKAEACCKCGPKEACIQKSKPDNQQYLCPEYECRACPEPICDPACKDCTEECVVVPGGPGCCPKAKCQAIPTCLNCPDKPKPSCNELICPENYECKVKPRDCFNCARAECVPKPCVECPTEPLTCICPRDQDCEIIPRTCYECSHTVCKPKPDPCADCEGVCAVTPDPNCDDCPPIRECVPSCKVCDIFLPTWTCSDPRDAIYDTKTCKTCPSYKCASECKTCPTELPSCTCENQEDCVLQPRSCAHCSFYYCKNECVKPAPHEPCLCSDSSLCVFRSATCFANAYYECVPPGKSFAEPADILFGRNEAKRLNYK